MLMFLFVGALDARLNDQLTPVLEPPPTGNDAQSRYSHRSIETLVVVLAVIIIGAVVAGFIARICGGRHVSSNSGEHDIEGWVERKCRSCIDGGIPPTPAAPPPPPAEQPKPAAAEEAKK